MCFNVAGIALCVFVLYQGLAHAQTTLSEETEEAIIEQLLEGLDEAVDMSEFTEVLRHYQRFPIDLNRTDGKDLADLLFITPLQIAGMLQHRELSGHFLSVLELQAVEGFDLPMIEKLLPFVTVRPIGSLHQTGKVNQQLIVRYARVLERQIGYAMRDSSRSRYLGDANRYAVRYRLRLGENIRLAINMKKDAGEPFFRQQQRWGFDHYGVSLHVKGSGFLKELLLGDYALQVGQGLVIWNGLSFGKGPMITTTARSGADMRSYTSMNEYNFLRGFAGKLQWKALSMTPFVSLRKLSGNRVETEEGVEIRSLSTSGLHRTPNELKNRQQINHLTTGLNVSYERARLRVGALGVYSLYNGTITPLPALRNIHRFSAQSSLHTSTNYQFTIRNIYLYGEFAYHINGTWAMLNGLLASLSPQVSMFLTYRNYQPAYYAPFSQALGEGSLVANERGVYGGISYQLARKFVCIAYADAVRFPWIRFRADAPSRAVDLFLQGTYQWYKKGHVGLRYRYRIRQENTRLDVAERYLVDIERRQVRLNFQYKLSNTWEIRSRFERIAVQKEQQIDKGILLFQDLFLNVRGGRLHANARVAYFTTDSYDARLYAFENDVLYANAFPLYSGKGWRSYANIRYKINKQIDLWARYSFTRYRDAEKVGTGLDQSDGPYRSEVKIQMRCQW
ncbi:ComEA family DNA-binding protein [Sphingobacterium griseoflavum]|uniref:Helix-hairpin-helix DNA-binding motif class 1 domain-containing protein n=1 Tax=Sphingobacterium griseoflavum TaxID=1474952 RepID=A0ABQ3HUS1_9SPHI|nr:helix-hairpin-helix domain-containing protein [Sphingobacterium griseoflavum]GHE23567.1 hypothetical protein GCM10017764_05350 [Sphingobacterium griseoflavum]